MTLEIQVEDFDYWQTKYFLFKDELSWYLFPIFFRMVWKMYQILTRNLQLSSRSWLPPRTPETWLTTSSFSSRISPSWRTGAELGQYLTSYQMKQKNCQWMWLQKINHFFPTKQIITTKMTSESYFLEFLIILYKQLVEMWRKKCGKHRSFQNDLFSL